uniref:AP-5 complex subunit beta-1 n=1 Tax=Xenopus tropicalis TaxID=8364 RepID=AP5B1_XENTR|nr:RecName: Full=AP-5 complex subunit beta-1; AltName: Full=Adaptor-related protein complex 5 beta subunit; Short=Beta5 [Xenopus tropicalis]
MAERNSASWNRKVASFCSEPKTFLCDSSVDGFLGELLKDLQSEAIHGQTKILMMDLLLEFPEFLCPDQKTVEMTAETLMNILKKMPSSERSMTLRCHLLLAIETVLITCESFNQNSKMAQDFASLLMHIISDVNDKKQGVANRPLRTTACECLRELESCYPGFLSQRMEKLYLMQQQEVTAAHQSYTLLYTVVLKNAIRFLAQKEGPSNGALKNALLSNEDFFWSATENMVELQPSSNEQLLLLPSNSETKDLKSILALLLEDSYLLTPVCQNTLFWQIVQVVAMARTISPVIFKSQLVRLFSTMDLSCFHSILQMKAVFTDSLFTGEDEHFLIQRLVGMTQHPLLSTPVKLFYLDCLLHFPENRPLTSNSEENLPVLLTVQMTSSLFPNVFNDHSTMLCRQNVLSMVYLENEGSYSEKGIAFLFEHVMSLYSMVHKNGNREITATFFRAVHLFVQYFNFCEKHMENLTEKLLKLYMSNSSLAPNFINLINQTQILLEFHVWPVTLSKALQKEIVNLPTDKWTMKNLGWHLKILSRVAQENSISQSSTALFLRRVVFCSDLCSKGDWRTGNALLSVCKHVLQHQKLSAIFVHLADLLQYLMHRFEDIDVQDRARLYYVLLTNVSSDKLGKILTMSPARGQTKSRSLSSIMTENENFSTMLTIRNAEKTLLCLQPVLEGIKAFTCISDSPSLYCIVLQFENTDCRFESISDINVPCLFVDRKPPVVTINLVPKEPYPTIFSVSATYSTQDGITYQTKLDPLYITFREMFIPLPLPALWPLESRFDLFGKLWSAFKPDEQNQFEESIFCYEMSNNSLHDIVLDNFSKFAVSCNGGEYKIAVFLPPQFHILMHIKSQDDTACFSVRTDNWNLLPYLNSHLLDITLQ